MEWKNAVKITEIQAAIEKSLEKETFVLIDYS